MIANWIRPGNWPHPRATAPFTRSESMSREIPPTVTTCGPAYCLDRAEVGHTAEVM